jgi:hypothetical protein
VGFSPRTDALHPGWPTACRRLAAGRQSPRTPGVTQRPGMPGGPADLVPDAVQPDADGALRPDCHQGHRSAEPVPAQPCLPVPPTGPGAGGSAWPGHAHKRQQHRKAQPLQADPHCRSPQPAGFCIFAGGYSVGGGQMVSITSHHDLRLTTARQCEEGGRRGHVAGLGPPDHVDPQPQVRAGMAGIHPGPGVISDPQVPWRHGDPGRTPARSRRSPHRRHRPC